ncbi:MAG: TauD/TfdA family dioxygenase [Alphaproteobacteria bacterium]|nr:TauD/TfdA family dioxygenase [Alphaproteobacteria bacterium]
MSARGAPEIRPITSHLGAEIANVDLSKPLEDRMFDAIHEAFNQHSVLVFRGQALTPEQHIAFSRRFGPLMVHVFTEDLLAGHPEIYRLSNVVIDGVRQGRPDAGQYWHSDLTYEEQPSLGSVMYALEVPEVGGDTMFVSTAHAFAQLSPVMQNMLEGLTAIHEFGHAFGRSNTTSIGVARDTLDERPPVVHPVVRVHSGTGRKCLFVNPGFTVRIEGMVDAESEMLLGYLYRHMTRPEWVLRHKWRKGDVVMWDNRALMHSGTGDYDSGTPRHMHRTTIADAGSG